MSRTKKLPNSGDNEHIFPATKIHELAIRWKELYHLDERAEAMAVLEEIVVLSTPMFERQAQYKEYNNRVDLEYLVSAAQEKVIKWLIRWNPKKGRIFSWFGKCAKNAFLSELVKENQWRRKNVNTDSEKIEKYCGQEDHDSDKRDLAEEFRKQLSGLSCRWGSPQEHGALRYLVECIIDQENHNRQRAIRGAAFAYGISFDLSKFFYQWVLVALRNLHYDKIRIPFSRHDLIRRWQAYEHFANLYQRFSEEDIEWVIATHGGLRIKVPTLAQCRRQEQDFLLHQEIDRSDKDPDSIAEIAKRHGRTPRSAEQAYKEMSENMNPARSGDYALYDNEN